MPLLPKRVIPGTPLTTFPLGPLHAVTLADAVDEFRGRYNGEWRILPTIHNLSNGGGAYLGMPMYRDNLPYPVLGYLNSSGGRWGDDKSDTVIFEYGSRNGNVANYTFNVDRQQVANRVYVPRVGFPEPGRVGAPALITSDDATSQAAMGSRYDAWIDPAEIELVPQRQALADFHVGLRSGPRRIVSFVPTTNAEIEPWVDYDLGDFVRFRALDGDTIRLDVIVRIYGITATLDNNGNESITLTTSEEATT